MSKPRSMVRQLTDFLTAITQQRRGLLPVMILGAAAAALTSAANLYCYAKIIDLVLSGSYRAALTWVAVMLAATLILCLTARACTRRMDTVSRGCYFDLQRQTLHKLMSMPYEDLERPEFTDRLRHLKMQENTSGGVGEQLRALYALLQQLLGMAVSLGFVAALLFQAAPGSGFWGGAWPLILAAVLSAAAFWLTFTVNKRYWQYIQQASEKSVHANAVENYMWLATMDAKHAKEIRIYGMAGLLQSLRKTYVNPGYKMYDQMGRFLARSHIVNTLALQAVSAMAYIVIGAKALTGAIGIGQVTMYAGAVLSLVRSIQDAYEQWVDIRRRAAYLDQYQAYLRDKGSHYDGTLPVEKRDDAQFQFSFEDVCFAYPGTDQLVLDHVSFQFTVGQRFALVGRNGAGKTTLIKLLCRLYAPTAGRILLNGIDIQYYDFDEYATLFSVVFQDFGLISGLLGENVACSSQVDEARAWDSLERAGCRDRFAKDGLEVRLYKDTGEDGVEVSGGEAQKIAIARALYKDAPFVILDEPTAALDPFSEAEIYEKFNDLIRNKTAIYISHRMSSCKFCGQILVMDQGNIVEQGSHEALLSQNGIYAALYEAQAQYYEQKPET